MRFTVWETPFIKIKWLRGGFELYPKTVDGGIMFSCGVNREERIMNGFFFILFSLVGQFHSISHYCNVSSSFTYFVSRYMWEKVEEMRASGDEWASLAVVGSPYSLPSILQWIQVIFLPVCCATGVLNFPDDVRYTATSPPYHRTCTIAK